MKTAVFLARIDAALTHLLKGAVVAAMVVILALLTANVFVRTVFPIVQMAGYDEIVEFLIVWMTFLGAAVLWREGSLFRVAFLVYALPPRGRRALNLAIHGLMLLFAVVLAYESWDFAAGTIEMTAFLAWPKQAWYVALPAAGILMTVYSIAAIARNLLTGRDILDPAEDALSRPPEMQDRQ